MLYSEMDICPKCGMHCDFGNDDIIQELAELPRGGSIVEAIRLWIQQNKSHMDIFQFVKDQSQTNVEQMHQAIGEDLTNKILTL